MFLFKVAVVFLIIGVVSYVISWIVKQLIKYKSIDKLPGPPVTEFLSKLLGNNSISEKYKYVIGLSRKYGSVLKIWVKPFDPLIMVTDAEFIEKILWSKEHLAKSNTYDVFKPYVDGDSIALTSNVYTWKRERKIATTAFQHSTVIAFLPIISKYTDMFLQNIRSRSTDCGEVDIQQLAHSFTLDIVFETTTGQSYNFQKNTNRRYIDAQAELFDIVAKRLYSPLLMKNFFFKFVKEYKNMIKVIEVLHEVTLDAITRAKCEQNYSSAKHTKHLIDILLADEVEDRRLNSSINTFLAAGSDSTAQALSFCLYQISKCPVEQQKLYEEIAATIGTDTNTEITNSDLLEMKYLEAVIKECIRIQPVVPLIDRRVSCDININGINYPKGTLFLFNLEVLHRSKKYFRDPDRFDPDRFMPENAHLIHRNSFIPFSVGPRDCIGKLLAMRLLKYVVARIVQKYKLEPVANHELKLIHRVLAKSENGMPVILQERK